MVPSSQEKTNQIKAQIRIKKTEMASRGICWAAWVANNIEQTFNQHLLGVYISSKVNVTDRVGQVQGQG